MKECSRPAQQLHVQDVLLHAGLGEEGVSAPQPRILRPIAGAHFARVAAGDTHSLGLTSGGQVYSWGEGSFGALGASAIPWACLKCMAPYVCTAQAILV